VAFEKFKRTSVNYGTRRASVRVNRTQMWTSKMLTDQMGDDGFDAVYFMVDRDALKIQMKKGKWDDGASFPLRYQVRNKEGMYTRAVINVVGLIREYDIMDGTYDVVRVSETVYEFTYEAKA